MSYIYLLFPPSTFQIFLSVFPPEIFIIFRFKKHVYRIQWKQVQEIFHMFRTETAVQETCDVFLVEIPIETASESLSEPLSAR